MANKLKIVVVAGARPNFVKVAPLVRALRKDRDIATTLVHTGQHYDESMSGQFFRDLCIPEPDFNLRVGSASHAVQTAEVMMRFERVLEQLNPNAIVVVGDVNSTLACALVAKKMQKTVIHIEAGLRSFDRAMPEEINRLATDAISDLLFVTEESGTTNLIREGATPSSIVEIGNLMIDSLLFHLDQAKQSTIGATLEVPLKYGVVTLHRPSNVDHYGRLTEILSALQVVAEDLPLFFCVHPRTRAELVKVGADRLNRVTLLNPLGYLDFLSLQSRAAAVLTDSGGIQEETTALGIPCFTIRDNTERPITIEEGTNTLAGTSKESILTAWNRYGQRPKKGSMPRLWDGRAAERAVASINRYFHEPVQSDPELVGARAIQTQ